MSLSEFFCIHPLHTFCLNLARILTYLLYVLRQWTILILCCFHGGYFLMCKFSQYVCFHIEIFSAAILTLWIFPRHVFICNFDIVDISWMCFHLQYWHCGHFILPYTVLKWHFLPFRRRRGMAYCFNICLFKNVLSRYVNFKEIFITILHSYQNHHKFNQFILLVSGLLLKSSY